MNEPSQHNYPFDPTDPNDTLAGIYRLARTSGRTVLDIGSTKGTVSRVLTQVDGYDVLCLDDEAAPAEAVADDPDRSVVDLEDDAWLRDLRGRQFDLVLLAEVLTRLRDPERVVRGLVEHDIVAADGRLVISVPNVAHESVVAELLVGDFAYTESGILDAAHVRWFTLRSLSRLLESAGFVVTRMLRTEMALEQTDRRHRAVQLSDQARALLATTGSDARTYEYVVECHRATDSGQIASLRVRLDDAARERVDEREQVLRLEEQARTTEEVLRREVEALRELVREEHELSVAEMQRGAMELEKLRKVGATADQKRLRAIERSRTYRAARATTRVGRRVLGPAVTLRRRVRGSR